MVFGCSCQTESKATRVRLRPPSCWLTLARGHGELRRVRVTRFRKEGTGVLRRQRRPYRRVRHLHEELLDLLQRQRVVQRLQGTDAGNLPTFHSCRTNETVTHNATCKIWLKSLIQIAKIQAHLKREMSQSKPQFSTRSTWCFPMVLETSRHAKHFLAGSGMKPPSLHCSHGNHHRNLKVLVDISF